MAAKRSLLLFFAAGFLLTGAFLTGSRGEELSQPIALLEAKKVFGAVTAGVGEGASKAIGRYTRGCIAGAKELPITGPDWQAMRLSRHRNWGHPVLLAYIRKLASDLHRLDGWPGILVGDMAQPAGGPLLGGHASHQIGLDVDLWYTPMPSHPLSAEEREKLSATNMVNRKSLTVDTAVWSKTQVRLLRRAASYPEVARIFVHPAVKKALCEAAGNDRGWLQKIRPWFYHDDHFHIRLTCPEGNADCEAQLPVGPGDGCGKELDDWFKLLRTPAKKPAKPPVPAKPLLVSDFPKECQSLLIEAERQGKLRLPGLH